MLLIAAGSIYISYIQDPENTVCEHSSPEELIFRFPTMGSLNSETTSKMGHYLAWIEAYRTASPSDLPAEDCLAFVKQEGPQWLSGVDDAAIGNRLHDIASCFKVAAKARVVLLGGEVPPSCDACDVLSENYDARVDCGYDCLGLFPVSSEMDASQLETCGCKAVERMATEGQIVNSKEEEWNRSTFFSSQGLSLAMEELAMCHADTQEPPLACNKTTDWPEVQAPDRRPTPETDLDEDTHHALFPTHERIRLSADAKYFHCFASGASLVDPGIQLAITDSGNDILIGDYCEAADEDSLTALQKIGAAAFSFLKLCVYAGLIADWHFDQLVAQTIQFRIIGYWRDHAKSRPHGVYGSRMTGMAVHRHIDLGITVGIVSASIATGQTMNAQGYKALIDILVLFNDLVDFRGDTWRNQRENVVLRGVRGCLCSYLDGLLSQCIRGAAALIRRGEIFALNVMCFCNWMLLGSGHKVYEIFRGTGSNGTSRPCHYESKDNGAYEQLLESLHSYPSLGGKGPSVNMRRKDLQLLYAEHRGSPGSHKRWLADVVREVLHPDNLRRLVDVVHYPWVGELGEIGYCA